MRTRSISCLGLFGLALASFLAARPALANNPIAVTSTGAPYKWTSFPIQYTVDGGTLGAFTNDDANSLTSEAFGKWTSVFTASFSVTRNAIGLGSDGDINTLAEFAAITSPSSCASSNPIIYDSDGSITEALFGSGSSDDILGFAGPCSVTAAGVITGMDATLNGKPFPSGPGPVPTFARSVMLGVMIHELGHALGLGHSQVNLNCLTNMASCPSDALGGDILGVPTMFPFLLPQTESFEVSYAVTLSTDDTTAISTLYPGATFATHFGTISGIVYFGDGTNHFQGANVVARRMVNPRITAASNVSGAFAQVDHGNPALGRSPSPFGSPDTTKRGEYTIPGLPPGPYVVEVESVDPSFVGGSNVGPVSDQRFVNIPLPSVPECFGGPESNGDNPAFCQEINAGAGNVLFNNDFILNDLLATMDVFDTAARNETIATATAIAAGTISASMSGPNDSDVDFYRVDVPAGQVLTVETRAERVFSSSYLDSVLDLMDAGGTRLMSCRIGDETTAFDRPCIDDDFIPSGGVRTLDSKLVYLPSGDETVYLRVSDFMSDFRPDFLYEVSIAMAAVQSAIGLSSLEVNFGSQYLNTVVPVSSLVVTNSGSADLVLSASEPVTIVNNQPENAFGLESGGTCVASRVLTPGAPCVVNITFQPPAPGAFSATISVASNASGSPQMIPVGGAAVDFTFESSTDSAVVVAGSSANFTLEFVVAPNSSGLPNTTTLAVSGLPAQATASFSPSLVPSNLSLFTTTLTVDTTRRAATPPGLPFRVPSPLGLTYIVLCLAAILGVLTLAAQKAPARLSRAWVLLVAVCMFAALGACSGGGGGGGGGGGTGGGGVSNPNGTPAGTYPLTVTATSGPVTRTTTVTLTVQ